MRFQGIRYKIIQWLSFGEPILVNWYINSGLAKDDKPAVYFPLPEERFAESEAGGMAVLVPLRNIISSRTS